LDRSALSAVRRWRFEPARRGAQPIETWVQVPVRFELK
jgi:periplasmic protein TonB